MNILRELRHHDNLTQAEIAERLQVSQQTIAEWENGESEPNIVNLRDLALIYDTSVDELTKENATVSNITRHVYSQIGNKHCFWGHLGLGLPNRENSIWYPITFAAATIVENALNHQSSNFIQVTTLNGRTLFINKNNIRYIRFLHEHTNFSEYPEDPKEDWEIGWDTYQGFPNDIYSALADYVRRVTPQHNNYSPNFMRKIEQIIQKNPTLSESDICYSKIYTLSNYYEHFLLLDDFEEFVQLHNKPNYWLNINGKFNRLETYINSDNFILIDIPSYLFNSYLKGD